MSQEERFGTRDRSYSAWHRRNSTRRFVGIERAQTLAMIDLDASLYVEYDDANKMPLALMETAVDTEQVFKTATVTANLACMAGIPAFVVLYKLAKSKNSADKNWFDIESFRVRRIEPEPTKFVLLSPQVWAEKLVKIREAGAARLDELWEQENALSIQF